MTKSEALDAFLSPKSRILGRKADKTSTSNGLLGPHDWAQKIATVLHPGPPFYSRLDNSDLIQTLGDASLMNCAANAANAEAALQKRKAKKANAAQSASADDDSWLGVGTIWSALDSLPVGTQWGDLGSIGKEAIDVQSNGEATDDAHDDGLWSSVSFCADLQGGDVALNKSVVIPSEVLSANNFFRGNREALLNIGIGGPQDEKADYRWDDFARDATASSSAGAHSISYLAYAFSLPASPIVGLWEWPSWVPFLGNKDKNAEDPKPDQPKKDDRSKGSKRVWIPSTTKTSFQAHWWGFTLWLPEPVMTELGKDADQAENIAKTVSKILSAILTQASKIPMPTALTTILTVLRSVAPVTNYVSSFIGWSWDELKSYDKGQGVALSATWILPVAMIPRTWDAPSAPPDTNGDGNPDGPPEPANPEQPKAPEQGQEPKKPEGSPSDTAPPATQPQETSDGSQQPAEPQKPVGDKEPRDGSQQPAEPQKPVGDKEPGAKQPDVKQPQTNQPDAKQPQTNQPDAKQPQTNQPDAKQPQTNQPDAKQPQTNQPDAKQPNTKPNAKQPDMKQPATKQPTAKQPEAKQPKTQQPGTKQPSAKQPDASPSPPTAGKPVASPPQDHAVQPKKPANQDKGTNSPTASPPDGTLPAPGASAPVDRGSQPPPTGAPPATLEPSKRGEYPKNNPATEKPAPGATLPPAKPTKEQLGMSTPDPDNENDGAKYGPAAPLGRGKAKQ